MSGERRSDSPCPLQQRFGGRRPHRGRASMVYKLPIFQIFSSKFT
jgi:hypothetical protein